MQGSIDSVAVELILRHEHESNVALSLFATDDRLKLKEDEMLSLFAKTGEVYVVCEFGWNNKMKVLLRWKVSCLDTSIRVQASEFKSKYQHLHLAAQIGNDSFVRPTSGENVDSFELITYK